MDRGLPERDDADALRRVFFTDANACISRAALERVPFREVSYAEDQLKKLRFNLQTGGLLLADACCGKEAFDMAFRRHDNATG